MCVAASAYLRRSFPQSETFAADMPRTETDPWPLHKLCSPCMRDSGSRSAIEVVADSQCRLPQTGTTRRTPARFAGSPPHQLDGDLRSSPHLTLTRAKWIPPLTVLHSRDERERECISKRLGGFDGRSRRDRISRTGRFGSINGARESDASLCLADARPRRRLPER